MHSVCSSTLSLSCKGSLSSYSFNDYSCVLNDRFDKPLFPLSSSSSFSSSCCACCSNSIYRIPINPSILYGLRQSTLIQWSPSRTLILGGLDRRRRSKIPVCNIDQSCYYEKSYSIRKGRNGCLGSEGRKKHQQSCDAEVMLSLLMEEEVGGRERNERSFRKVKLEKGRKSFGGSDNVSKKIIDSGVSGGKSEYESIENEPKEKRGQEEEEKEEENSWREENHKVRARKDGSSSSSYYSVDSHSSSAEFEGDSEIQLKGEKSKTGEFERNVGYYGENQEHRVVSKKKNNEIYDMRKKSEKKLDEVTIAEASSVKNSSKMDANEKKYSRTVDSDAELKKYKQFKEISDIQQSNIEEISRSRMKTKEEESTVIENSNILKDKEAKHEERIHKQLVSRRKSQQSTETSISQDVDLQKMSVSDRKSDTMIQKQEERDSKERINKQTGLRRKSQQSTETSISHDVEMSVSDMKSGAMIQKQEERDSNVVFSSNSQRVHEEISSNQTRYRQKKHNHLVDERLLEIEERKEEDHEPSTVSSSHEDAIGSADRLHKSSMKYVGEFLEKARQEISTIDEIRKDEKNREEKGPADEMWDVADRESIDTGVVVATAGTTTAGDDESSGGVKRSGRSLWNIMGDIVRLRWISRSENRSSSSKSGGKPSPNQSTRSETWFSGHEQFEKNDEGLRKEKTIIGKQPPPSVSSEGEGRSLSSRGRSSPSGAEAFEKNYENTLSGTVVAESSSSRGRSSPSRAETSGRNYENTLSGTVVKESSSSSGRASPSVAEAFRKNYENTLSGSVVVEPSSSRGRSSPSGAETFVKNYENTLSGTVVAESSSSKGRSSPSSTEPFEKNYDTTLSGTAIAESSSSKGRSSPSSTEPFEKNYDTTLSGTVIAESSSPLPAIRMRRSPVAEETTGMFKTETSSGGLTRTKLQRKNQFPKDRYDEWEEAYKLETEQRKIDEMFMREALVEAKKAADNWEVPVGAVLVQHGKIIARGCNLVEELRDSTAHAEMICIREASNVLRTWRLSETTLYVTLEPCPMCAGAILQARVDTVVWGAPNKLLGADGSWIRLFPDGGEEGGEGSEETDKVPPAPKHPFHPKITVRRGVLASECADIMQQFFQLRRRKKETKSEPLPTPPSCLPISHHPSKFFTKMHDAFHIMFCL